MENITQYLTAIVATAIFGAIAVSLLGEKGAHGKLVRVITGVLLTLAVVLPLTGLNLSLLDKFAEDFTLEAGAYADQGVSMAKAEERRFIKTQLESYIVDKAASYNIEITADVTLSCDNPPMPISVQLHGTVTPYAKTQLKYYIAEELSIPEENQRWI